MRLYLISFILLSVTISPTFGQNISDDFEGNGNITSWTGDDCGINTTLSNPVKQGTNTSNTVLGYNDIGGLYANVRFDLSKNLILQNNYVFSLKIYVPSSGITGSQTNQISLKLQDGKLTQPWSTQTEIIKPLVLDQWQTITFDFANDKYINQNTGSPAPTLRIDFNRVLIQVNGENNLNKVVAYIDDFLHVRTDSFASVFKELVWFDEFDSSGVVNSTKWHHQTRLPSGGSWFNGEIQHYTNRVQNSVIENGILKVIAKKESFTDQGVTKQYTSARLNSKFAFKYGRVEFRAKLPTGNGTWPAVWLLGKNINEQGAYWDNLGYGRLNWPACGEIDILEHWGSNQNFVQSAMHTTSSFGNTVNKGGQTIPTASSEFHVYAMEWTSEKIVFSVDDNVHYTYNPSVKDASTWPFDAEQYFIINFAVQPNIAASFTEDALEIDYIRVYQKDKPIGTKETNEIQPVSYYPNPIENDLNIQIANSLENMVSVSIHGIDGKLVLNEKYLVENNHIQIQNLAFLQKGVYVVSYSLNQKTVKLKVVKN
jgi:beta-glucanase (GH16 family)